MTTEVAELSPESEGRELVLACKSWDPSKSSKSSITATLEFLRAQAQNKTDIVAGADKPTHQVDQRL